MLVTFNDAFITLSLSYHQGRHHKIFQGQCSRSEGLLRSESPSGKWEKLHTAAASTTRDHAPRSLCYCLFAPRIYGCCSSRTFRSWWTHAFNETPNERLQQAHAPLSSDDSGSHTTHLNYVTWQSGELTILDTP